MTCSSFGYGDLHEFEFDCRIADMALAKGVLPASLSDFADRSMILVRSGCGGGIAEQPVELHF
jgi:hypothetical protein